MEHLIIQKQAFITGLKPETNSFNKFMFFFLIIGLRVVITKQIIKSAIKTKGIVIINKRKRTQTRNMFFI